MAKSSRWLVLVTILNLASMEIVKHTQPYVGFGVSAVTLVLVVGLAVWSRKVGKVTDGRDQQDTGIPSG